MSDTLEEMRQLIVKGKFEYPDTWPGIIIHVTVSRMELWYNQLRKDLYPEYEDGKNTKRKRNE